MANGSVGTLPEPRRVPTGRFVDSLTDRHPTGLFGRVSALGYYGAELYDQLVIQQGHHDDLVAEIKRFDTDYSPPAGPPTADSIGQLIDELRELQGEYLDRWANMCPVLKEDIDLLRETRVATGEAYRGLTGFTSPERFPFASRQAYEFAEREYRRYLANGGRLGFGDWLIRYRYGGDGDQTRPRADREPPPSGDTSESDGDIFETVFANGRTPNASELVDYAERQGWTRTRTSNGPIKYVDENGIARITIKAGSDRAPGSGDPHVELKDADGNRVDRNGDPTTRRGSGNHTPIVYDLPRQ